MGSYNQQRNRKSAFLCPMVTWWQQTPTNYKSYVSLLNKIRHCLCAFSYTYFPVHNPPQRVRLRESTVAKCAACFILRIPCDWEPCNCLSWFISRTKDAPVSVPVIWLRGWIAVMLHAWGDTASRVQVVAIRKFKSMTAQGQSPSKVIIFRHLFQAPAPYHSSGI